jgi:hypothetical protein
LEEDMLYDNALLKAAVASRLSADRLSYLAQFLREVLKIDPEMVRTLHRKGVVKTVLALTKVSEGTFSKVRVTAEQYIINIL